MTEQMTLDSQQTAEPTALIQVTSLPQIHERLHALRERWEQYAADAAALVCTEDTVQAVKATRADMRREFDEADAARKAAKAAYMAPWDEIEATYKECVSDAFKCADGALKGKIDAFETELKDRRRAELQDYFSELCAAHGVDFLDFDTAMRYGGLKIALADAKSKTWKKLKTNLADVVAWIAVGVDQIAQMAEDDRAEIMAEYKQRLDVGAAVATVDGRKRRIAAEREAENARRTQQEAAHDALERVAMVVTPSREVKEPQRASERLFRITFTINCTREQGLKVREFLERENIKYE